MFKTSGKSVLEVFALCAAATLLMSCDNRIPSPSISDSTLPWSNSAEGRVLSADVSVHPNITVVDVYVRYTRHYWPGKQDANDISATAASGTSNTYTATLPGAESWPRADHLFYEWFIDYRRGQSDIIFSRSANDSAPHDFVIGCTNAQMSATLTAIGALRPTINDNYVLNPGYSAPSHYGPVSLANQGIAFARPGKMFSLDAVTVNAPDLLLFAPRPKNSDETNSEYFAAVTDMNPETGSRLVGFGYGVLQNSATRRPTLGCIPSSHWMIHEAGIHTTDGGMTLYPLDEQVPGETVVNGLTTPQDFANAPQGVWHPRIWDLHFWLDPAVPGGIVEAIDSPTPIVGLPLPQNIFFRPQTFE